MANPHQQASVQRQPLRSQMPPPPRIGQPPSSPLLGYAGSGEHSPSLHVGNHPQIRDGMHPAQFPSAQQMQHSPGAMLHRTPVSTNASTVSLMKALSSPTAPPGKYP